jgi:hypothetical protein
MVAATFAGPSPSASIATAAGRSGVARVVAPPGNAPITTVAGGPGRSLAGPDEYALWPQSVARDGNTLYVSDLESGAIRALDLSTGTQRVVAGTGETGALADLGTGDGGPATAANLVGASSLTVGPDGSVFFVESAAYGPFFRWPFPTSDRVRRVAPDGTLTTVAGTGERGVSADGGLATQAQLQPTSVSADGQGNLFIADDQRVRRVDTGGIITTIAGALEGSQWGDGGAATETRLGHVWSAVPDSKGNVFLLNWDEVNWVTLRKVDTAGIITTVATSRLVSAAGPLSIDAADNLYVSDNVHGAVSRIDPAGTVTTVGAVPGPGGGDIVPDGLGGAYLAARDVVHLTSTGSSVVMRSGVAKGDRGVATNAQLSRVGRVAAAPDGTIYAVDVDFRHRGAIRAFTPGGAISTVTRSHGAGSTSSGDDAPAIEANVARFDAIATDLTGNLYLSDRTRIRRVDRAGIITTIAGNDVSGYAGDGGPAVQGTLGSVRALASDGGGNLFFIDAEAEGYGSNMVMRLRVIDANGILSTIATLPWGLYADLAVVPGGDLVTLGNAEDGSTVLEVQRNGTIRTRQRGLDSSIGSLVADPAGNLYWGGTVYSGGDTPKECTCVVTRLDPDGGLTTIAGVPGAGRTDRYVGLPGYTGDGGPAIQAELSYVNGLAFDASGTLYIGTGARVRAVPGVGGAAAPAAPVGARPSFTG